MIEAIFTALTEIAQNVVNWFGAIFEGTAGLFYKQVEGEGQLTLLGTLMLISAAVSVFYFVLRWIINLVRMRAR